MNENIIHRSVVEDGETGGGDMCLGATRGKDSDGGMRGLAVLYYIVACSHVRVCFLGYRLKELGRNKC